MSGGYFAGYISTNADGTPTHKLIIAPKESGEITGVAANAGNADFLTCGAYSMYDGLANTNLMVAAGTGVYPAAQYCRALSIGGYTDWYLPSLFELEIAFFNLKPGTGLNSTSAGTGGYKYVGPYAPFVNLYSPLVGGRNPYAIPNRSGITYSAGSPPRTGSVTFYATGPVGPQRLTNGNIYRTSTQAIGNNGSNKNLIMGIQTSTGGIILSIHQGGIGASGYTARAIRKEPV